MRCSPANIKSKDMGKLVNEEGKEAGKGLYKLHKEKPKLVEEQMGYKMVMGKDKSGIDSSHSFPMKQAYTIRMSPILQTENEDGVVDVESYNVQLPGGTLGTETVSTTTETIPGSTIDETVYTTGKSLKGLTQEQLDWRTNEIKRLGGIDAYHKKYGSKEKGKARTVQTTTPDQTVETQKVEQEAITKDVTPLSNIGERQNMRRAGTNVRLTGKYQRKSDRFENRADKFLERKGGSIEGLSKKDKAKYDRLTAKSEGFQNVADIGKQRASVFSAQAAQGGAGSQLTTVDKILTPGQRETLTIAMPPTRMMKFKGKKSGYKK